MKKKKPYDLADQVQQARDHRQKMEKTVIKRRKYRDTIRKKIAQMEGVNWKRVVLTSKVPERKLFVLKQELPTYTIKR